MFAVPVRPYRRGGCLLRLACVQRVPVNLMKRWAQVEDIAFWMPNKMELHLGSPNPIRFTEWFERAKITVMGGYETKPSMVKGITEKTISIGSSVAFSNGGWNNPFGARACVQTLCVCVCVCVCACACVRVCVCACVRVGEWLGGCTRTWIQTYTHNTSLHYTTQHYTTHTHIYTHILHRSDHQSAGGV